MRFNNSIIEKLFLLFICISLLTLNFNRNVAIENLHNSALTYRSLQLILVLFIFSIVNTSVFSYIKDFAFILIFFLCYENLKHLHASYLSSLLHNNSFDIAIVKIENFLSNDFASKFYNTNFDEQPILRRLFNLIYSFYYILPFATLLYLKINKQTDTFFTLKINYYLQFFGGLLLYIFVPVAGPSSLFNIDFTGFNSISVNLKYQFDCFPSLHTSVPTSVILVLHNKVSSKILMFILFMLILTIIGILALHIHYFTDVIAGIIWAILTCFISIKLSKQVVRNTISYESNI